MPLRPQVYVAVYISCGDNQKSSIELKIWQCRAANGTKALYVTFRTEIKAFNQLLAG